jgi:hypothetical protein
MDVYHHVGFMAMFLPDKAAAIKDEAILDMDKQLMYGGVRRLLIL